MTMEVETRAERTTAEHLPKFMFKYLRSFISVLLLISSGRIWVSSNRAARKSNTAKDPSATVLEAGRHRTLPIHH